MNTGSKTITFDGKYLHMDGALATMDDDTILEFQTKVGDARFGTNGADFVIEVDLCWDVAFGTLAEAIVWLNKNDAEFVGCDDKEG